MTIEEHLKALEKQATDFKRFKEKDIPDIVGTEAVNFFSESFQNEGFTDTVLEKWQEVNRRIPGTLEYKRWERSSHPVRNRDKILLESNNLSRSIEADPNPDQVKITADTMGAESNTDYAKPHNEGTTNAGRNHNVTIPKRQFIGESKKLDGIIKEKIEKRMRDILK